MIYTSEENFLLTNKIAKGLYYEFAEGMSIVDYHNHLSVKDLIKNLQYEDIAELWLLNDPYKHRAMRICGVEERLITGDADNYDKFYAWCSVFPQLLGNPLYHWSQMELFKVFGSDKRICEKNARYIWEMTNEKLKEKSFSAMGILESFNVDYAAPCCGITEDVSLFKGHKKLAPSLRGDEMFPLDTLFINRLEKCTDIKINSLFDLQSAFTKKIDEFHHVKCRFSDHALDDGFKYFSDDGKNEERFLKVLRNEKLSVEETEHLNSAILRILGKEYAAHGWVMQLHSGARRYTSSRLRKIAGPAGGFAGIGSSPVREITKLLDDLEIAGSLPRTIIFTLNPTDNAAISILSGSFNEAGMPGKVQQGTAWWWCDHISGMRDVFESISAYGVLSTFLGMTTDSRSILSFVRHDYFRRIFCDWLGEKAENGIFPNDLDILLPIVKNVCGENVKNILKL